MSTSYNSTKKCVTCNERLDSVLANFFRDPESPDGLRASCKKCICGDWPETTDRIKCAVCGKSSPAVKKYFHKIFGQPGALWGICVSCKEADPYEVLSTHEAVKSIPKGKHKRASKRKERIDAKPNDFTDLKWAKCLAYWKNKCAYCSKQSTRLHADHYIPISSDESPGTIPTNMVPACAKCNLSKHDKYPHDWVMSRFGMQKGAQIVARIDKYFVSLGAASMLPAERQESNASQLSLF